MGQTTNIDTTAHQPQPYRPEVDGLRALAVIAVMLCHAGFSAFAGGFIGVDVFFVISGFVVANSILGDLRRDSFSYKVFYARRAKRLAPALYLVLAVTFVFSVLFRFPEDSFRLSKNILAVATLTSNIYLSKQTGYFDATAADQPLLHTWSLSVEEQFYIVLPFLLVWLHRRSARGIAIVLAAFALLSFGYATYATHSGRVGAFYFAQNRAFEFLAGVLFAYFEGRQQARKAPLHDIVFIAGLALLLAGILVFSKDAQFPGTGALLPCSGAVLLIFAGRRATLVGPILSNRLAVFLGRISYPLYLWHWPVFFALHRFDIDGTAAYAVAIAVAVLLSILTYAFVERPVQRSSLSSGQALKWLVFAPLLAVAGLAGVGKWSHGFLFAYPSSIQQNVHWSGTSLFDMPRAKTCWSQVGLPDESACTLGTMTSTHKAVLWGDSHAYHLIHFFDALGHDRGLAIRDVAFTLCPPIENMSAQASDPAFAETHRQCIAHDRVVMDYLLSHPDVQTVFLSAAWQNYQNLDDAPNAKPNLHGFLPGELERELGNTIGKLLAAGKRVVILDDVPMIPMNLVNCSFYNGLYLPYSRRDCQFDSAIAQTQHAPIAAMQARLAALHPQLHLLHTYDVPCAEGICKLDFDGLPIYRYSDYHHLSLAGSTRYYGAYRLKHPGELEGLGL